MKKQILRMEISLVSTMALTTSLVGMNLTKPAYADFSSSGNSTRFSCVTLTGDPSGSPYATIAIRPDGKETSPLLLWRTQEFSASGYTPKRRCTEVTNRLNQAVWSHGGRLGNLYLSMGYRNGYLVLCYVNDLASGCNAGNQLLTLNSKNQERPNEVMSRFINFAATGTGSAIQESGNRAYVKLEDLVNAGFGVRGSSSESSEEIQPPGEIQPSVENNGGQIPKGQPENGI